MTGGRKSFMGGRPNGPCGGEPPLLPGLPLTGVADHDGG